MTFSSLPRKHLSHKTDLTTKKDEDFTLYSILFVQQRENFHKREPIIERIDFFTVRPVKRTTNLINKQDRHTFLEGSGFVLK